MRYPMLRLSLVLLACVTAPGYRLARAIPVFPGAVGFGTETPAGRGSAATPSTVFKVTNLNDSGTGSLRAAMESSIKPRVVIFEVSGVITLTSDIKVRAGRGQLTVAGQTAPAPGIIIKGAGISIQAKDVLIQHIAVRPGNEPNSSVLNDRDCIKLQGVRDDPATVGINEASDVTNVVIDHVSCSWSVDEVFSTWGNDPWGSSTAGHIFDVTVSNSILAEALKSAGHTHDHDNDDTTPMVPEDHAMGPYIGRNSRRVSMIRNIMAHNHSRNPMIASDMTDVQIVNNFIYRPADHTGAVFIVGTKGTADVPVNATVRGNVVYLRPSDTSSVSFRVDSTAATSVSIYESDNSVYKTASPATWYHTNGTPWNSSVWSLGKAITQLGTQPALFTNLNVPLLSASALVDHVKATAGARSAGRDPVDTRILNQIETSTGDFIDTPNSPGVGGYPSWPMVTVALNPPTTDRDDVMPSGYTKLEEWLHGYSAIVEGRATAPIDTSTPILDNFEDQNPNGWGPVGTHNWAVVADGGGYVYRQSDTTADARAVLAGTNWTTQVIETDVTPTAFNGSDRWFGLFGRYRDTNNYYYFILRSSGVVELKKMVNGSFTLLGSAAQTVALNTTYKVRFELNGTALKGYVNGVLKVNVTDAALTTGSAAIGMYKAAAKFNNVLASPAITPATPFGDMFDSGAGAWTPGGTHTWSVVTDGTPVYRQTNNTADAYSTAGNITWTNQVVSADLKANSFNGSDRWLGLLARWTDASNYYYLTLRSSNAIELKKIVTGGTVTLLDTAAFTVATGTVYDVKLEVVGNTINGYINGQLLLEAQDTSGAPHTAGKIGVAMYKATAQCDDVLVAVP